MRAFWRRGRESVPVTIICAALLTTSMLFFPTGSTAADDESSTLRIGVLSDTPDFNIFNLASNSMWKHTILDWSFEGIAVIDYDSRPFPLLAESWTFNEVTLTVDIYLREGVKFHDGEEMHADDVHFSYLMARDGTTYSYNIIPAFDANQDGVVSEAELNSGVQMVSDYHVRMVMAQPFGQFLSSTLTVPIMPKHVWEHHVDPENRVDVTWGTDPDATIGTGPFFYAEGVSNDFRVLDKYTDYWGKDHVTPDGYWLYPPNVDRLYFAIMGNIDSAISALTDGLIDHIASPVPADKLPLIDAVPTIAIDYLDDAGYFYLAFNQKKEPFGSILFRKAVSHLIDKTRIVDDFMGGLGSVGTTPVPSYFGAWHNEAVVDYAYDDPDEPSTQVPEFLLDEAGFIDSDGDGWRDLPDGTPMEKLTILTPPADYDPVRAQTGFMIADNLVKVGIDAEACPVDILTIVEKLESFEYQMLILGFRFGGYSECVSVLFDIFGHASPSNMWAFWSDANTNPFYSDLGDVSTLADAPTQALVDEFADLEDAARSSFDVVEQIDCVRAGQEITADAVPVNVLYYRVNAMATSVAWTGWVPHMGSLMNMFSLSELEPTSAVVVERLAGPASDSAVSVAFQPKADGQWHATIQNDGLRAMVVSVYEVDGDELTSVAQQKVSFKGDPNAVVETEPVSLLAGHVYRMVFLPMGPEGGSASVAPSFEAQYLVGSVAEGTV